MILLTAQALVAHLIGDYLLQSDWMATTKTSKTIPAATHALVYSIPFLFLTHTLTSMLFIIGTHFVIDRWRLARYVVWSKNFIAPKSFWPPPFSVCSGNGYPPDRPIWLTTWLLIIADNTLHIMCNGFAMGLWG